MRVALRIGVSTLHGLRQGVPNLLRLFSEYQVRASFFFPLGRDFSGRSPVETWRQRKRRGLAAITYGTLVPAPPLHVEAGTMMDAARADGHEVGLYGVSPWKWARRLALADPEWVAWQCESLWSCYLELGGNPPCALASPDWQVNPVLLGRLSESRYRYSSLTRGKLPYFPILQGERSVIPEIPTTLPTVDELLRQEGVTPHNVHEYLYAGSRHLLPAGHVYAATAEREGMEMLGLMEKLLVMWKGQDGSVRTLGDVLDGIEPGTIPHHQVGWGVPEGRIRHVAMQSLQVPA